MKLSRRFALSVLLLLVLGLLGLGGWQFFRSGWPFSKPQEQDEVATDSDSTSSTAADPSTFGPDQVAVLLAVRQQLADAGAWKTTQFSRTAWEQAADWLFQYLSKAPQDAEGFSAAVRKLRDERFRTCIDPAEQARLREEVKKLQALAAKGAAREKVQLSLSGSTIEVTAVIEAAYLGLAEASGSWRPGVTAAKLQKDVLAALHRYERALRAEAQVRLLLEQPAWVLDLLGDDAKKKLVDARAALERMDAPASASERAAAKAALADPDPEPLRER
jgi:hypothetical protein